MMLHRTTTKTLVLSSWMILLLVASVSLSTSVSATNTAVLFGATGAVGNEVLRAILAAKDNNQNRFFTKLVLVGRRAFPPSVEDLLPSSPKDLPAVVRFEVPNLAHADEHEGLVRELTGTVGDDDEAGAVACFLAVGAGFPQNSDFHDLYFTEVAVAGSIARLCGRTGSNDLTVFTSVDAEADPEPCSSAELAPTGVPMGWWNVVVENMRIMGMKEQAVISNARATAATASTKPPIIRIFEPSSIITEELRYGWTDWTLFKLHAVLDPWIPTKYHSVPIKLLATAMVQDAMDVLTGRALGATGTTVDDEDGVTRFTYSDFVRIAGEEAIGEGTTAEL